MYAVSLTTIPPRLPRIAPVLASLLAQRPAPAPVFLCLPDVWQRFPGRVNVADLPPGVTLLRSFVDHGPATKVVCAARHVIGRLPALIYCDDDWIYPPGWAAGLLSGLSATHAAAASCFSVTRLKRAGGEDADIAQGFAGVAIDPSWLAGPDVTPPAEARYADDIWLSGQLRRQGLSLAHMAKARQGLVPAYDDRHSLQSARLDGMTRSQANLAALAALTRKYGIWPALE